MMGYITLDLILTVDFVRPMVILNGGVERFDESDGGKAVSLSTFGEVVSALRWWDTS